jgi:hypothetical protein
MTTRERVDSPVIRRIFEAYRMDESDIVSLYERLERQLTSVYRQTIQRNLIKYGCQKTVTGPDAQSTRWIQAKARKDSEGISNTFDRELMSQIQKVRAKNKRANRFQYIRELDAWIAKRNGYKVASISLNTLTAAREYAAQRFRHENNINTRMRFVGPPPVCRKCIKLFGLGAVSVETADRYGDSQHGGCPHRWEELVIRKIDCSTAWTG